MSVHLKKIESLSKKYSLTGQDTESYLEGLLLSNYMGYWDYVHLDTLLTLQTPKTDFPDEKIFIIYHQITELYFKLCLHEIEQISDNGLKVQPNGRVKGWNDSLDLQFFKARLKRINNYFDCLIDSFSVMIQGMDRDQFTKFRMALLPASGFQSVQYRKIEIACTDLINLVHQEKRDRTTAALPSHELLEFIYWKRGAIDLKTGKKTYTLKQFEKKYNDELVAWANRFESKNIWKKYLSLKNDKKVDKELTLLLKELDRKVNVDWPLVHIKSAARYLESKDKTAKATGGTNWKKYLPPRFQRRVFFPELHTDKEIKNWGA